MKVSELDVRNLIHEAVKNQEKKAYKGIHASALGGCPRAHYYHIKGIEETTPPNVGALMNFKMGDVWEETLFPLMEMAGVKVHHHKGEDWNYNNLIFGTPDFSVECEDGKVILDAKTVNSAWFNYKEKEYLSAVKQEAGLTKNEFLLRDNPQYEIQQGAYLLMAESMGLKGYKEARLIFVNKDNSYIGWQVVIKLTDELRKKIIDRAVYLQNCIESNFIPDCECEGWKVGYSNYGRPSTRYQNAKKKWINKECCALPEVLEEWRKEELAEDIAIHPNDTKKPVESV